MLRIGQTLEHRTLGVGGAHAVDGRDNAWRSRAPGPHAHGNTARQVVDGLRTEACGQQGQSNDPRNNQHNPQYANYWAPLTRKRHIPQHPAQPLHTNHWAARTRKRHQQEHRPQRPTESSDPTQHAKGRTGDCPGPRKETTTRRNVTRGAALCRPDIRLLNCGCIEQRPFICALVCCSERRDMSPKSFSL